MYKHQQRLHIWNAWLLEMNASEIVLPYRIVLVSTCYVLSVLRHCRFHWPEYCGQRDGISDGKKYFSQVRERLACHTVTCWCLVHLQRNLVNIQKWLRKIVIKLLDRFGELVPADQRTLPDDVWTVLPTTIWDAVCSKWQVTQNLRLFDLACYLIGCDWLTK